MALFTVTYRSDALKRDINFKAVFPYDFLPDFGDGGKKKLKTLYMLHGLNHNYESWLKESRFDRLARDLGMAVVFPDGQNSFYVEGPGPNSDFGKLVGEELVNFTRSVFPLSDKREDTFIGGFSMGGFGALRNGLKYADTFSKIIAFSSAVHMFEFKPGDPKRNIVCNEDMIFGDYDEAVISDKNPAVCLKMLSEKVREGKASFPKVYMICGLQDGLLEANRSFRDKLLDEGVDVIYREYEGIHSHEFVNEHLKDVLTWMVGD